MVVCGVAEWLNASGKSEQRLVRKAADAFRVRIGPAEDPVNLISKPDVIIVRGLTSLCHRLSQ